jgi:hypothetical protein
MTTIATVQEYMAAQKPEAGADASLAWRSRRRTSALARSATARATIRVS